MVAVTIRKYAFIFISSTVFAPVVQAAGDMLTPSQVTTTGESSTPTNESGLFLGVRGIFGQGRSTGGGGPGVGYFLALEPGYQVKQDSWNRIEVSTALLVGRVSYREADSTLNGGVGTAKIDFGALINGAWGYSLGGAAFGLFKAGVGPIMTSYSLKTDDVGTYKADDLSGLAWQLAYDVVVPATSQLDVVGGIALVQLQLDPGSLRNGTASFKYGRTLHINMPSANIGIRSRF